MRTPEQIKAYSEKWRNTRMFHCDVCNEDMKHNNKHRHLHKWYHISAVDGMLARGEEVPKFIRKVDKNWQCPICNNGIIYRNRSQHTKTKAHKENVDKLISKDLPVPDVLVNKKLGIIVV